MGIVSVGTLEVSEDFDSAVTAIGRWGRSGRVDPGKTGPGNLHFRNYFERLTELLASPILTDL
jgi:hypothetical protein